MTVLGLYSVRAQPIPTSCALRIAQQRSIVRRARQTGTWRFVKTDMDAYFVSESLVQAASDSHRNHLRGTAFSFTFRCIGGIGRNHEFEMDIGGKGDLWRLLLDPRWFRTYLDACSRAFKFGECQYPSCISNLTLFEGYCCSYVFHHLCTLVPPFFANYRSGRSHESVDIRCM